MKKHSSDRLSTGVPKLDYVLGGGLARGCVTILAGSPGTGKTTLLMQVLESLSAWHQKRVVLLSWEQRKGDIKKIAEREGKKMSRRLIVRGIESVDDLEREIGRLLALRPAAIVVDSLQATQPPPYGLANAQMALFSLQSHAEQFAAIATSHISRSGKSLSGIGRRTRNVVYLERFGDRRRKLRCGDRSRVLLLKDNGTFEL